MAGRGRRGEGNPLDELDQVAAIARQLERVQRAQAVQEEMLRGLAENVAALVDNAPAQHPPPASWLLGVGDAGDPGDPGEVQAWLRWLTGWVKAVYLWYPGARLPTCWLWHPSAVEELFCLAQAHREAYEPPTKSIARAAEWHDRLLPGVLRRLSDKAFRDCDLSQHTPDGDRHRTEATPAPLADAADRITTEWLDHHVPDPTQLELNEAQALNNARTHDQN